MLVNQPIAHSCYSSPGKILRHLAKLVGQPLGRLSDDLEIANDRVLRALVAKEMVTTFARDSSIARIASMM